MLVLLCPTGDNLDEYVISALTARKAQRSYPSSVFLLPNTDYWTPDEIIITTPKANYTTRNYTQLFKDLNYTVGLDLLQDTQGLVKDIKAPGMINNIFLEYPCNWFLLNMRKFHFELKKIIEFHRSSTCDNLPSSDSGIEWLPHHHNVYKAVP